MLTGLQRLRKARERRTATTLCQYRGQTLRVDELPCCGRTPWFYCAHHGREVYSTLCKSCSDFTALSAVYDLDYYEKTLRLNSRRAHDIAQRRWQWIAPAITPGCTILDYGSGAGWFRAWRSNGCTVDTFDVGVTPQTGVRRERYTIACMWDVLEHLPPGTPLPERVASAEWLALSVPVLPPGQPLDKWKHYKPGEHLRNYTERQLLDELIGLGYEIVRKGMPECPPREDILDLLCHRDVAAPTVLEVSSRRVIIKQGQSPGDVLTLTRAVGDLKRAHPDYLIDVRTSTPAVWLNNPHLTPMTEGPGVEVVEAHYDEINDSASRPIHFVEAFRHDLEARLGVAVPPAKNECSFKPELYISSEELSGIGQVERETGWKGPYWIINAGYKPDNELKAYHRWNEVAQLFAAKLPTVRLVQIGHLEHIHPGLEGVLNLVGKTSTRQLIVMAARPECHGVLTPISFPFVVAAALEKPCVVVAGGKESVSWHTYPHVRWLATNGALKCCPWAGCWKGGSVGVCTDQINGVPRCFTLIKPEVIVDAVMQYYEGGRLTV